MNISIFRSAAFAAFGIYICAAAYNLTCQRKGGWRSKERRTEKNEKKKNKQQTVQNCQCLTFPVRDIGADFYIFSHRCAAHIRPRHCKNSAHQRGTCHARRRNMLCGKAALAR